MAIVLRVTAGIAPAVASLAPEPTVIDPPLPPLTAAVPAGPRPVKPVMLPGCIVDIPPEPIMKNPEEIAVPLAELPA